METDSTEFVRLGDVLPRSYKNGIYKSAECYGHGVPILRITDFDNDGCLVTENLQKLELDEKEVSSYELGANDIVVNRVNSLTHLGKAILWTDTTTKTVYESNMMRIEPDEAKVHPQYLIRILQSYEARVHFKKVAKRAVAQCSINQQDVKALRFRLPPLSEQKKIAQILSTWDKAITTTEQLLANSQQQKKALMQQLLTGKKRLLDKNGVRFSGGWRRISIGKIIKEIKKEKEANPNSIELLTVKLHYKGVTRSGKFPNATERGRPYFKRFAGELIIGRQNLHNGGIAIVSDECNGLIASNAISSFEAQKDFDANFILSVMSTEHFRFTVDNLAGGTGQKEIGVKDLLSLSLVVPGFDEQKKISAVLSAADQEISALQQKLDVLKQEKKALMQQLLTGKRRVTLN